MAEPCKRRSTTERKLLALAFCCAAMSGTSACGPSRQERARERALRELRAELGELRQYTQDLKLRLQLAEARNRVLIDLVQGLTTDPEHYVPKREQLATADASLRALEADVEALVSTVRHSQRDVVALQAQREQLQAELAQAKRTISEARATHAETDARLATLRAVIAPLIEPIRAGRVNVSVQHGQLALQLPEAGLFEAGDRARGAQLSAAGKTLLDAVAQGLRSAPERKAHVLGPPEAVRSAGPKLGGPKLGGEARVLAVIDQLAAGGVPRENLIAASHAVAQLAAPLTPRFFEISLLPLSGDRAVPPTTEQLLETMRPPPTAAE